MPHNENYESIPLQNSTLPTNFSPQLAHNHLTTRTSSFGSQLLEQTPSKHGPEIIELLEHSESKHGTADNAQKPKTKLLALWHFSWVHLPSIVITFTLLSLYIKKYRWNNPTAEALNGLQFAAKAHEALILLSLGDMLLHRISRSLGYQDVGVPLGFLPSAFYLGAPFVYLFSRQLWAPIRQCRYKATGGMIVLVILIGIAASPLSAVAMIPRQAWWSDGHVNVEWADSIPRVSYSRNLDLDDAQLKGNWSNHVTEVRPSLISQYAPFMSGSHGKVVLQNVSFSNYGAESRPISTGVLDYFGGKVGTVFATCPTANIATYLAKIFSMSTMPTLITAERDVSGSAKPEKWKQPLVAVECDGGYLEEGNVEFYFDYDGIINKTISMSTKNSSTLAEMKKVVSRTHRVGHGYPNIGKTMNLPVSADMLFASPTSYADGIDLQLCFISARWIEVDTWLEPAKSMDVLTQLPFPIEEASQRIRDAYGTPDFIHIDDKWMAEIASLPDKSSSNASFYNVVMNYCDNSQTRYCLERLLAMEVIDAISMAINDKEMSEIPYITLSVYTYEFNFNSSRGIPLAFSVLLLHAVMVLVHLVIIIVSAKPWTGTDWDSFGDLLIFALRSKPPDEFDSIGGQGSKSRTWATPAVLKSDGDDGERIIVLRDEPTQETSRGLPL